MCYCPEQWIHILFIRLVLSSAFQKLQSFAKLFDGSLQPSRTLSFLLVTNIVVLHVLDPRLWGPIIHESHHIKVKLSLYTPAHLSSFTHRERAPNIHWIRHWVGPRDSLDFWIREKSLPLLGFKPWIVQLVAESVYHPLKQTCILIFTCD
jgi:hypothetical protein